MQALTITTHVYVFTTIYNLGREILPCSLTDEGINVSGQPRDEASSDHCDVSSRLQTPGLNSDRKQQNQIFPAD